MTGDRRRGVQARRTKVKPSVPLKKTSATGAERGSARDEFVQAGSAQNPFPRILEKTSAGFAKRGKKRQLDEFSGPRGETLGRKNQDVSDSAFSWQSMHSGVQGSAFNRFLPMSL